MCGMIQAKRRRREKKRPKRDLHSPTDGHPNRDAKEKGGGTHGPGTAARGGDPQGIRKRKPRWNLTDKKKAGK